MMKQSTKRGLALGLAISAVLGVTMTGGSAHADPQQYSAFVGVGSDTIQDVMNAYAGFTNNIQYTPLTSSSATLSKQVISFDAVKPAGVTDNCITTKLNGSSFFRPNGSGAGRKALAAANGGSGTGWTGGGGCGTAVDISGQVDFARSSGLASATGTDVTFIPFGRDGVSFATYRNAGGAVTSLTIAQLQSLYTSGPQTIGGVRIVPCGLQTSSGTFTFWNGALGVASTEAASTNECNTLAGTLAAPGVRIEENDGTLLKNKGTALAGISGHANDQVIVAFSAASWIAKTNLVAAGAPPAGVALGTISDIGAPPFDGSGTSLTPNATFYANTTFGRFVYVVLPSDSATGPGNAAIKDLFVGASSKICAAASVTTMNKFGFLATASCGSVGTTRAWEAAAS
jgi:hypothetical protein